MPRALNLYHSTCMIMNSHVGFYQSVAVVCLNPITQSEQNKTTNTRVFSWVYLEIPTGSFKVCMPYKILSRSYREEELVWPVLPWSNNIFSFVKI